MKINILTIFPEMFNSWMNEGVIGRAIGKELVEINIIDFRDYTKNKHKKVDDYPFGGGEGMLLMAQPLFDAIKDNKLEPSHIIYPSPKGTVLTQKKLASLSLLPEITLVAGRYEGIDQRFIDTYVNEEVSLGDYIITGGELAIQVILDGVIRLVPKVLGNQGSFENDSFSNGLLEHPQYTRPANFRDLEVPDVLLSGHHLNIKQWEFEQQIIATAKYRPELIDEFLKTATIKEKKIIKEVQYEKQ